MKRLLLLTLVAVLVLGAALAYQTAARDRQYRALLAKGDAALREDQTFGAIEAYSGAIAVRADSTIAHLRRGETYRRRGDLTAAARDFRQAAALDRSAVRPLEELGDVLYQQQKYSLAAEAFDRCLRLDDRQPRVSYKLGLARFGDGNVDGALAAALAALRLDDRMADAHYLVALCQREKRRLPEALAALERALALAPASIPAREELADLYAALGRPSDELEQLQLLVGLDRDRPERQVAVGLAQARAGHAELAVVTLGTALERTRDQLGIYAALGRVWLDIAVARNDAVALSKAIEALQRVAEGDDASSEVLTLYGRALAQDGQLDAAEAALTQATERLPAVPASFLQHASVAERLNHFEPARRSLMTYEALQPEDREFAAHAQQIAGLSMRLNDPATAIDWLERASRLAPTDTKILLPLAEAQLKAGERDAAQATIARALEREPANQTALALARRAR